MDLCQIENVLDANRPVVALNGNLQLQKNEKEENEKTLDEKIAEDLNKRKLEKYEKLIKAKDNSIKTFIIKNDSLTTELLGIKEVIYEKDMAFNSVKESLQVVADRCNAKTKQVEEQQESNQTLADTNASLSNEVDVLKRRLGDMESEVLDYQSLNDENNDVIKNQKQMLRRREDELLDLRREHQDKIDRQEESTANVKKQAERSSTENEEVKEQLRKLREKMDNEKQTLFEDIQNIEKEKAEISAKLISTENQLRKSKEENMTTANNLSVSESDLHALQLKLNGLTKEKNVVKDDLNNQNLKVNSVTTENKAFKKELDEIKIDRDTLVQQKSSHTTRITALQRELEDEKDKTATNNHLLEELRRQCQQHITDINLANSRTKEMAKTTLEEEAESRRKWQTRLKEAEDDISRLSSRLKASEKNRAEQCADLEQVTYELGETKKGYSSLEKKHHNNEQAMREQTLLDQENREQIENMKRRLNDYMGQISSLKEEKEDGMRGEREQRRKVEMFQDKIDQLEHDQETAERRNLEMSRQVVRLQEQLETANCTVTELGEDMEKANNRSDKSHKELLLAMEQHTNTVSDKDEEVNMVKKTCRGTLGLLKDQLDVAEQDINKLSQIKKDLEQEVLLIQGDLDEAEATVNELNNEIPRQQDILEQLNMSLGEVTGRCEALQEALVRADIKCTQVNTRNEALEDEIKKEQMYKRLTEQDNIDLNNKLSEQVAKTEGLLETLGKIEEQLDNQTETLELIEGDKSDWEMEKRKMRELVTALEADNQHLEEAKNNLEISESKLKTRLRENLSEQEDMLKNVKVSCRTKTRALDSRLAELESVLEEETEKRTSCEKAVKKLERLLKEMEIRGMEDTQSIERQVEQIGNLTNRNKQLKVQYADSESRVTSLQSRLRKMTSEMEESENRAATMSKMLATPASSRCTTPSGLRQSAMMRNSLLGSRPCSRLISPEVEQILMSGRNSPAGPLSILSGRNSPALGPISPGYMVHGSPSTTNTFNFEQEEKQLLSEKENKTVDVFDRPMEQGQELEEEGHEADKEPHNYKKPAEIINKPLELCDSPSPKALYSPGEVIGTPTMPHLTITSEDDIERRLEDKLSSEEGSQRGGFPSEEGSDSKETQADEEY